MIRPATLLLTAFTAAATACASSTSGEPPADAPTPAGAATPASLNPSGEADADAPAGASTALFTEEQAARGRSAFRATCADCHYSSEFRDAQFKFKWGKRTVADLYENIVENMPEDAPGSLPAQEYLDVVSYILQMNGFSPGARELTGDEAAMQAVTLEAPSGAPSGGPSGPGASRARRLSNSP